MENHNAIHGKTHYFYGNFPYVTNYCGGKSHETTMFLWFSKGIFLWFSKVVDIKSPRSSPPAATAAVTAAKCCRSVVEKCSCSDGGPVGEKWRGHFSGNLKYHHFNGSLWDLMGFMQLGLCYIALENGHRTS